MENNIMNVTNTNWRVIEPLFKNGALILGNGSSIAIDACFNYESLYNEAQIRSHITSVESVIFTQFLTTNFETVLKNLARSAIICNILDEKKALSHISSKYQSIREALYKTVLDTHPNIPNATAFETFVVSRKLEQRIIFLENFRTIINLNYDVLLYWMTMWAWNSYRKSISTHTPPKFKVLFKDCFINDVIMTDRLLMAPNPEQLRENVSDSREVTLVFYPHGNLILANDVTEDIPVKIKAEYNLLETVNSKWKGGSLTPLIVCEGESKEKRRSIESNPYTSMVFHYVLPEMNYKNKNITILGWSVDRCDQHILSQILRNKPEGIAISYYLSPSSSAEIAARIKNTWDGLYFDKNSKILKVAYPALYFFPSSDAW
jgi:hypothetical protein